MGVTVETGARLHFGFMNLSAERDPLFGSVGAAVDGAGVRLRVKPADTIACEQEEVASFAADATALLDVPGASVTVEASPPRHVGLGSGTQLALATLLGIARAYDRTIDVRAAAPAMGRGGRSGIGVAAFEGGGFVFDGGHERPDDVLASPPPSWDVPPVILRQALPESWRFVCVLPDVNDRVHGTTEHEGIARVLERANPAITDRIAATIAGQLLPALARTDATAFGKALTRIDQLNGQWFQTEQSDAYHPAVRPAVAELKATAAVAGVGQSSWGPLVYGLTTASTVAEAEQAARRGLERTGKDGSVLILRPRNDGAAILAGNNQRRNINLLHGGSESEWSE